MVDVEGAVNVGGCLTRGAARVLDVEGAVSVGGCSRSGGCAQGGADSAAAVAGAGAPPGGGAAQWRLSRRQGGSGGPAERLEVSAMERGVSYGDRGCLSSIGKPEIASLPFLVNSSKEVL